MEFILTSEYAGHIWRGDNMYASARILPGSGGGEGVWTIAANKVRSSHYGP